MPISIATTESPGSSLPTTPSSVGSQESNFSFDMPGAAQSTSNKTAKIAGAIFLGALAIVGAALLAAGTVATFGILPFALVIAATVISGIGSMILAISAAKNKDVTPVENADVPYVLPNPVSDFSATNIPDLCALVEAEHPALKAYEKTDIHPNFARDCVRDRERVKVEGKTFAEHFPVESELVKKLKEVKADLESRDVDELEMDLANLDLETAEEDLQNKILAKLTQVISAKLGENSPLTAAITVAISQNMGSVLNSQMQLLAGKEYGGAMLRRFDDPQISNTYSLEFQNYGASAVVVRVASKGEFSLLSKENEAPRELSMPCSYEGSGSIFIAKTGEARMISQVDLTPA